MFVCLFVYSCLFVCLATCLCDSLFQSVRQNPPSENFLKLENLVSLVVFPYLKSSRLSHTMPHPTTSFKRSSRCRNRHRAATEGKDR